MNIRCTLSCDRPFSRSRSQGVMSLVNKPIYAQASFGPCRRSSSILQTRGRVLVRPRARDHLAARGVRTEPDPAAHSPPLRLGTRAVLTPPSRLATVAGFSERSLHEQSLVSPNERRERGAGAPRLLVAHRAARAAHGRVLGELCGVGRQASGPRRLCP